MKNNIVLLLYLRDTGSEYSIKDMMVILSKNHLELKQVIKILIDDGFLINNDELIVSKKGLHMIDKYFKAGTTFNNLIEQRKGFCRPCQPIAIGDIFIPSNFSNEW